jgi:hypothetical protein
MPFMNMINDVNDCGLFEFRENLQTSVMVERKLKKDKKALASDSKVIWDPDFSSTYHLEDGPVSVLWNNHQSNGIFHDVIRRTP